MHQCTAKFGQENPEYWFIFCCFTTVCPLIFAILAYITAIYSDERPARSLEDNKYRRYESVTCKFHNKSCYEREGYPFYQRTMTRKTKETDNGRSLFIQPNINSKKENCSKSQFSASLRSRASEGARTPIQESADRRSYVISSKGINNSSDSSSSISV
ncbi:Oidioi.mRNA.OKI2018_I69.chr2.g5476.t1.cds [Oikopleura dioica]|uniref:Oidioi.mRNA.OKI2018_I69.chr2.g5476.t1.cds n=1 Tax=Oikopleura dioica TaxID=34765 RepID=A0ABN7T6E0_OIKDI|nr:Oidioi.mRNA.OKI2018_I69.chr2.g5476.t1.cds [Oikopleura dioica]